MAASTESQIGDQIVTDLNVEAWDMEFTARRVYDPTVEMATTADLQVLVVAMEESSDRTSRASFKRDLTISIGLIKRLATTTNATDPAKVAEIDNLSGQAEAIAEWFRSQRLYAVADHELREVRRLQPEQINPGYLRTGIFTSVVVLIFQKF